MPGFSTAIVLAGVLIFIGGLIALGAQKARQMGSPLIVSRLASYAAGLSLLGAVALAVAGISGLSEQSDQKSEQASDLDRVLN